VPIIMIAIAAHPDQSFYRVISIVNSNQKQFSQSHRWISRIHITLSNRNSGINWNDFEQCLCSAFIIDRCDYQFELSSPSESHDSWCQYLRMSALKPPGGSDHTPSWGDWRSLMMSNFVLAVWWKRHILREDESVLRCSHNGSLLEVQRLQWDVNGESTRTMCPIVNPQWACGGGVSRWGTRSD
jgi:hypothetical protein